MNAKAMFKISYGLYVLTASEGDKDNGCIINTFAQLTSTPLTAAVTVNKANYTHDMIKRTGKFNVSVIDNTAPFDLFKHFGFASGRDTMKFGTPDSYKFAPKYADNGLLYVSAYANAYMSCKVIKEIDLGTHTMFIAEIDGGDVLSDKPSMTYEYYHANVKPQPKPKAETSEKTAWVCRICGYVYEGENLPADYVCPVCKHGADDFERVK